jgi:ribosomal protein L11 methyltransferase
MAWLRLTLEVAAGQVEAVTEFLEQFNAGSISFQPLSGEPRFAGVGDEPGPWRTTSISAMIDAGTDMDILLVCLRNRIGAAHILNHRIDRLEDRDWTESYKKTLAPLVFADRLCICPSWHTPEPGYKHTVILDPGLAFGSGTHATTRMCLDWLAGNEIRDSVIIDYGCGSGILALAAARLGARHVYAVDIDPQALAAVRENTRINDLETAITIQAPGAATLQPADILIANILLQPLLQLADLFNTLVTDHGRIVLSGLLATQVQECLETFGRWFKMEATLYHDEWALIYGRR